MNDILSLCLLTAVTGVGGLALGGFAAALIGQQSSRHSGLLVAFTAGAMLGIACLHLAPEAFEHSQHSLIAAVCLTGGFLVTWLLNCWIDKDEHHADKGHPHQCACGHHDLRTAGMELAVAVALHNMPVGMAVGASAAADGMDRAVIFTALAIALHNLPEGASIAAPILSDGESKLRAVSLAALSGVPTVLGALIGYFVGSAAPLLLTVSLALAAGAMLYVVFFELIPEALESPKLPAVFLMVVGVSVSAFLIQMIGHHH